MKVILTNNTNPFVHKGDKRYDDLPDPSKCTPSEYMEKTAEFAEAEYTQLRASNRDINGNKILVHEGEPEYDEMPDPTGPEEKFDKEYFGANSSSKAEKQQSLESIEKYQEKTPTIPKKDPDSAENVGHNVEGNLSSSEMPAEAPSEAPLLTEKMPELIQKEVSYISPEAEKSDKSTYNDMCEFIQLYKLRWLSGGFWIYDQNFYRHLSPHELKILIGNYTKQKYGYIVKKFQADFPVLMEAEDVDIKDPPRSDLIAFRNALLDSHLRPISPHPDLIVLHQINANYVPSLIGKCPTWHAFIDFQTGENPVLKKRFFQAFALLLCNANAKKFVVFYGIGDSGKSVVMRFLSELFPNDTFPLNLNQFGEKFVLECTSGKKFGICADLPAKPLNKSAVGIIKEITGGDRVNAQAKYGAPHELLTEGGFRAVFASNHPLVLSENDDAFWNRLVYIAFTKAVPKEMQDPNLLETLLLERDAFVNTCMQELPELLSNNFNLVGAEETKEAIAKYQKFANRSVNDLAFIFFESALVIDEDCFTKTEDIKQAFCKICDVCVDASAFGKLLRAYLLDFPQVQEARLPNSQGKARGYKGIKLVQPVDLNLL